MKLSRLRDLLNRTFDDAYHLQGRLITPFLNELKDLGCSKRKEALVLAKQVYDKVAKAIDIPFVGETTEQQWEEEFWVDTVLPLLNQAADRVCGPIEAKTDAMMASSQLKQFDAPVA